MEHRDDDDPAVRQDRTISVDDGDRVFEVIEDLVEHNDVERGAGRRLERDDIGADKPLNGGVPDFSRRRLNGNSRQIDTGVAHPVRSRNLFEENAFAAAEVEDAAGRLETAPPPFDYGIPRQLLETTQISPSRAGVLPVPLGDRIVFPGSQRSEPLDSTEHRSDSHESPTDRQLPARMPDSFFRPAGAGTSISYEGETSTRVLKFALALVFHAYDSVRSLLRRVAGSPITPPLVVLMYHSVKRDERERFKRQIDQLVRLAHPVYADFQARNDDRRRYVAVTFDDGYHSVLENAFPILIERGIPATLFVPTQHLGKAPGWITDDRHRDASERLLTADELRQMQKAGAMIGSHGVTHRPLTQVSTPEAIAELRESRRQLTSIIGQDVNLFALPYGAGSDEVVRLAASAGYRRLFLNVPVHRVTSEDHMVGRIEVSPTDWPLEYGLKIRGAYQWLPWAMAAKRRVLTWLRHLVKWRRTGAPLAVRRAPKSAVN